MTIGRFQPFHRGHAKLIRSLASRFTKVLILVAGNSKDEKNPFSYETRVDLIKKSLLDIEPKIEVYKATWQGKNSGFIPGILSDITKDHNSSIDNEMAVNLLVGEDRFSSFQDQIERAKGMEGLDYNPELIKVDKITREDEATATQVRDAIKNDDVTAVKNLLDPHISSDDQTFQDVYETLKSDMGVNKVHEELDKEGGEKEVERQIRINAEKLKNRGVNVQALNYLGQGQMGVAFDMGGGKVFKVTTDASEAKASNLIKGKGLDHVVEIFDVFRFPNTNFYGIVQEKLNKLTDGEKADVRKALDYVDEHPDLIDTMATKSWDDFSNKIYDELAHDTAKELGVDPEDERAQMKIRKGAMRRHSFVTNLMKDLEIPGMMQDLRKMGIQFADYHEGNIMKRNGKFVINDLGMSKSPGGEPPKLESISKVILDVLGEALGPGMPVAGIGMNAAQGTRAQSSSWSSPNMKSDEDEEEHDKRMDSLDRK